MDGGEGFVSECFFRLLHHDFSPCVGRDSIGGVCPLRGWVWMVEESGWAVHLSIYIGIDSLRVCFGRGRRRRRKERM